MKNEGDWLAQKVGYFSGEWDDGSLYTNVSAISFRSNIKSLYVDQKHYYCRVISPIAAADYMLTRAFAGY